MAQQYTYEIIRGTPEEVETKISYKVEKKNVTFLGFKGQYLKKTGKYRVAVFIEWEDL